MSKLEESGVSAAPALRSCWACAAAVDARVLFCHACGAVQGPGNLDHYARLGLAVTFDIDQDRLEQQYLGFQRVLHPDRFVGKPPRHRVQAEAQSASLNQAYETLKDPLRRAAYLLELRGGKASIMGDATIADPALLMENLEAREALAAAANKEAVEALTAKAGAEAIGLIAALSRAFAADNLAEANDLAIRFKYLRKYLEEARIRRLALERSLASS